MPPTNSGKNHTPLKPLEDSSLTYDESEDLSFRVSKLEDMIKESVKTIDLLNLKDKIMGHIDNKIDVNMKRIVYLLQNSKENISTSDDKDYVHLEQPSINKNIPRGIDSNNGSNLG